MAKRGVAPEIERLGIPLPLSEEQKDKARRYVASVATDAEDAAELLSMLGLHGPTFLNGKPQS